MGLGNGSLCLGGKCMVSAEVIDEKKEGSPDSQASDYDQRLGKGSMPWR